MPARFFGIFLGLIAAVLIIGGIFINMISGEATVVEYWILLLLPMFWYSNFVCSVPKRNRLSTTV